ncbi:MAG TPA: beta-propeller fold lactonase family protein [Steroidobacteraceae bacterium]
MLTRRRFAGLLAGALAAPDFVWPTTTGARGKTVLYSGAGPELSCYAVEVAAASLEKRGAVELLSNVQYAWPHPSREFLYVSSSDGGPGQRGSKHYVTAFQVDSASGDLRPHGDPIALRSRPIHNSVDRAGEYLLVAYNDPSGVSVHRIAADGSIGAEIAQPKDLDCGFYGHQIFATPSGRSVLLVTRGSDATANRPEDPGSIKVFGFNRGLLENKQSVQPGKGLGFGPRHLDFHPTRPWVYVSIERQNKLYVYELTPDGGLKATPLFIKDTLAKPSLGNTIAGPIHVHPNGKLVYLTNRGGWPTGAEPTGETLEGMPVYQSTDSSIAVFAIDQGTGEPTLMQQIDAHGAHPRTFSIDASGRVLIAASLGPMALREGGQNRVVPAGLSVFRIEQDGGLKYARRFDVETGDKTQFWSGMVELA